MKQLYILKTKRRSIFLVLLLMMTLPMVAQTVDERFKVGGLMYSVLDATKHTLKVLPEANYLQLTDEADNVTPAYAGKLSGLIDLTQPIMYNNINWKVTEIDDRAFNLEKNITEVRLPDGTTRIGKSAFYKTTSLSKINFPASLKAIEQYAFYESGLTEVNIPGSTAIGYQAFFSCVNMERLSIPNVTYMGYRCFHHCSKLSSVTVPASAKLGNPPDASLKDYNLCDPKNQLILESGKNAFSDCYNLKTATIQEGVTTIPNSMFIFCSDMTTVTFPASVKSIENDAFRHCFSLSSIDIPEVETIGKSAFLDCCNLKGDLVLSNKVKEIKDRAFEHTGFTGVKWEGTNGCKIGNSAFAYCYFLEYLDLHTLKNPMVTNNKLQRLITNTTTGDNLVSGLLSRTIVYLPQGVNFTFAEGKDVNFVKSDGNGNFTCTKLSVQDGADYEFPIPFTAKEAVYNRWDVAFSPGPGVIGDEEYEYPDRNYYYVDEYECYEDNELDESDPDFIAVLPLVAYRDFYRNEDGKNCFTMLLPYEVKLPKGFRAYKLHYSGTYNTPVQGEYEYKDYYLFRSIPDGSTLEANKPYLLRIVDGKGHTSEELVATNVTIAASGTEKIDDDGNDVTTQTSNYAIHSYANTGTLKPQGFADTKTGQSYNFLGGTERLNNTLAANLNTWLLNTDYWGIDVWRKVHKSSDGTGGDENPFRQASAAPVLTSITVTKPVAPAPFRAYIQPIDNTVPAKSFVILMDNETTGIDSLERGMPQNGTQRIYTLDGRYAGNDLNALPSGIYVIKGKKTAK